jgi:GNAT superfamily N-acetyltransferase
MQMEQFDATTDHGRLRSCFDMTQAGWPVDHPDEPRWAYDSFAGKWGRGYDTAPRQAWLATDDGGEPVGGYLLQLPEAENTSIGVCILIVAPAARRAGVGRALLSHCAEQARRAGRSRLIAGAVDGSPGAAFAAAMGARAGIAEVRRTLTVDAELRGRLAGLRATAGQQSAGYSLLSWRTPAPAEHLDQLARIHSAMADAPRDEGVEPHVWDAARIRYSEQTLAEHRLICYAIAARHDATGELVALTEMIVEPDTPDWAFQQITAVLPAHRGHRLGLLVKVAMVELLLSEQPAVRHIQTGNAGSNAHMIAINEQLGFKVADVGRDWELSIAGDLAAAQS